MMLSKECKAHLKESGMGPFEHARFALGLAFELQVATAALVVHAVDSKDVVKHMQVIKF